jgi:serine phosphatase RsbU (regulator of sigma subunit)
MPDSAPARQFARLCEKHKIELLSGNGPFSFSYDARATVRVIVGRLSRASDDVLVFCVELPQYCDGETWPALVQLLAEGYQQAAEFWGMRGHFRMNARVDHELEMAHQIQDGLLPRVPTDCELQLSIGYEPSRWVGGDYVDVVPMPDGRVLLAIADVCGKGLQASLVASALHTLVHVLVEASASVSELIERANAHLCQYLPEHSFVTMACIAVDPRTRVLECINAGHLPPLLVSRNGRAHVLQVGKNVALGMMPFEPQGEIYPLEEGDVLCLYTDGVTEAGGSDAYGAERLMRELERLVASTPGRELDAINRRLVSTISVHREAAMASDDTAFLLASLNPTVSDSDEPDDCGVIVPQAVITLPPGTKRASSEA